MRRFILPAHQIGAATFCSAALLTISGLPAQAACFPNGCSQNGLVFSEASSSFNITSVTGAGTQENPFVVYQDVRGLDISLAIDSLTSAKQHSIFNRPGFAISIVSHNLTGEFWRFYDHELQEIAGHTSGEDDGLSFAQGIGPIRPYTSSHYNKADEITDVRDFINFYQGDGVNPGETVRFDYFVTDTIPNERFYIRQRPDYRPNTVPTAIVSKLAPQAQSLEHPPAVQYPKVETLGVEPTAINEIPLPKVAQQLQASGIVKLQDVPEPSTVVVGLLTLPLGLWTKRDKKRTHAPQLKK